MGADVPGIPGYLVLRDLLYPYIYLCEESSRGCPRNPGILSIEGSAIAIPLCDGSSQGCLRNPGMLSIEGSYVMGVPKDVPGILGHLGMC